jgi:capsular polysaccharide biosynthesis protein
MELLALFRTIARHKIAVMPVLVLMVLGMVYTFKVRPPTYKSSAELILVSPPAAPSPAQIQAHPKLAKVNANNPYLAMGDLTLVGDAVMDLVTAPGSQAQLAAQGAGSKYQVAMSSDTGFPPILDITGVGQNAAEAILSAKLVTAAAARDLIQMQRADGVNPKYLIKGSELLRPTTAQNDVASKLRLLIAVLGAGAVLMFLVVSAAEAFGSRRQVQLGSALPEPLPVPASRDSIDNTQEFASPFLSAAAQRVVDSLAGPKPALPQSDAKVAAPEAAAADEGFDLEKLLTAHLEPEPPEAVDDEVAARAAEAAAEAEIEAECDDEDDAEVEVEAELAGALIGGEAAED